MDDCGCGLKLKIKECKVWPGAGSRRLFFIGQDDTPAGIVGKGDDGRTGHRLGGFALGLFPGLVVDLPGTKGQGTAGSVGIFRFLKFEIQLSGKHAVQLLNPSTNG